MIRTGILECFCRDGFMVKGKRQEGMERKFETFSFVDQNLRLANRTTEIIDCTVHCIVLYDVLYVKCIKPQFNFLSAYADLLRLRGLFSFSKLWVTTASKSMDLTSSGSHM